MKQIGKSITAVQGDVSNLADLDRLYIFGLWGMIPARLLAKSIVVASLTRTWAFVMKRRLLFKRSSMLLLYHTC